MCRRRWASRPSTISFATPSIGASPTSTVRKSYATFEWIGGAIKGLPREKLFLQSKIPGQPEDVLKAIDRHRQVFDTDYIDSLLIHCMVKDGWTDQWKRVMDGFEEAKARQWIRAKGVSCHSLPALRTAVASDWPDVHLVRVNPQAKHIDGPRGDLEQARRRHHARRAAAPDDAGQRPWRHRHEAHRKR